MCKFIILNNSKFFRKNNNKFLYLRKKKKNSLIICDKATTMKNETLEILNSNLKRSEALRFFNWIVKLNKNRTKKPVGSKLGSGKGKIDHHFKAVKKYNPLIEVNYFTPKPLKFNLYKKIFNFRLKVKC